MIAALLMSALTAESSGTSTASQSHAAIVLPLLGLLVSVLFLGAMLALLIRKYLRKHNVERMAVSGRSIGEPRGPRIFQSPIFHCPNRWLAVKSHNPQAVQKALGLNNPTPCSWTEGMARVSDQKLFVSPPVNGWVLVVGSLLPDSSEDVDACFRFLHRLSRELGEVQFFNVNRAVGHHAWARLENGRVVRGYAWAGETLWNQGQKTWGERKLGLKCFEYLEGDARAHFAQLDPVRANAEKVLSLASLWSVDPTSVDDSTLTDAFGIAGDLSQARPR
jgi:hypothetical protein